MTAFDLVLRSGDGHFQTVRVAANDATQARNLAGREGWQVLTCEARRGSDDAANPQPSKGQKIDVASLAHEFASLLSAGLSVPQTLQTLASAANGAAQRADLDDVALAVSEGMPLSTALARRPGRFPPLLVATVRASEQTGNLSEALSRYAEHQQTLRELRDKVTNAAIYPALLLSLGTIVVVFLLVVVVPKFAILIESTRTELPWSSALLMSWGRWVAAHGAAAALLAACVLAGAILGLRHVARTGARARWVEAFPVIGPLIRQFRHAQLFRTTGMLVKGGLPLPQALALGETLLGYDDQRRLGSAIALLREGRAFSEALKVTGLADPVISGMVSVAERTGALAEILERIALFKESRLRRAVDWATRLIEPILMIFIGLVIGAIVVMMYLPIFDLASSLQ